MPTDEQNRKLLELACRTGLILDHHASAIVYDWREFPSIFKHEPWSSFLTHHHKKSDTHPALKGGVSYVTPTPEGLAHLGLSRDRAANDSNAAVMQRLAVSWFAHADLDHPRHVLLSTEAEKILGGPVPNNVTFVGAEEKDGPVFYRVYCSSTGTASTLDQVRAIFEDLEKLFRPFVTSGQLGVAILCGSREKAKEVHNALHRKGGARMSLDEQFLVHASFAPGLDDLADALKAWRTKWRGKK